MTGHCSQCRKIWTLAATQGKCKWCGKLATCQPSRPQALRSIKTRTAKTRQAPVSDIGYEKLDGEWLEWLEVARRYEVRVPSQDRGDIRHTIILELALARAKTQEPIPLYRAYRIASYMVADYYRQQRKLTTGLECKNCSKAQRAKCRKYELYGDCPKLIKLISLDTETVDSKGRTITLKDTLADDKAIDLDMWLDTATFLLGCPLRLVQLAYKRQTGIPLTETERRYFNRQRAKELKRYQKSLF